MNFCVRHNNVISFQKIVWFNPIVESKVPLKSEASGSEKAEEPIDGVKDESKMDEKKEGSDDEEIEEERSWRRGYDAE